MRFRVADCRRARCAAAGALVIVAKRSPPAELPLADSVAPPGEIAGSAAVPAGVTDPDVADPGSARDLGDGCSLTALMPDIAGDYPDDEARLRAHWGHIVAVLDDSLSAEHLVVGAFMAASTELDTATPLLERAIAEGSDNPLVAWMAMDACTAAPATPACAAGEVERLALDADGDNGAVWARVASRHLKEGETAAGFAALQRAATAPQFNTYWPEQILMLERALAASTNDRYGARVMQAIGIAAAIVGWDAGVVETCRSESLPPEHRPVCLAYGERLTADANTEIGTSIGLAIQRAVLSAAGDTAAANSVNARHEALRRHRRERDLQAVERFVFYDENLLRQYIDVMLIRGESAAIRFLGEETERLLSLPGYDPCAGGS
ncbi:MAG: hypothetical protein U5K38_13805 [Woeseiaceae bacterium]|nr:hypothetical protein [Woeseiaceae bacterium]